MAPSVLLREGRRWVVVDADRRGRPSHRARRGSPPCPSRPGSDVSSRRLRRSSPATRFVARALAGAGHPRPMAGPTEFARARSSRSPRSSEGFRALLLVEGREALERTLASPEETVIALAREEERVERARTRDDGALASWVGPAAGPLADHAAAWQEYRVGLERHHAELVHRLEGATRALAPNLARVVGARVAWLVAAAGGLAPLGRMPSARLQLLGSRRRLAGGRGPRFGLLYRAEGLDGSPRNRQGSGTPGASRPSP